MIHYIFYSIISLGISLFIYLAFLKREKFFVFNRLFLLCSLCLCLLAPVLQINYGFNIEPAAQVSIEKLFISDESLNVVPVSRTVETVSAPVITTQSLLQTLYWIITGLFLARFTINLCSLLFQIRRKRAGRIKDLKIVLLSKRCSPYTFFNYMFIHPSNLDEKGFFDMVLIHEKTHSRQHHSADILLIEFLSCFFWFNPFLWFYKKEIVENHEYLADEAVVSAGCNRETYATHIINSGSKIIQPLLSGFSFIQTKNRLNMLHTKRPSGSRIAIKAGIALILFIIVFTVSSFSTSGNSTPFIVVVDAGHGGQDTGTRLNGSLEKEINLAIATQLQVLGSDKEVKIILLRDNDEFLSLQDRVEFVNKQGAHFFLSLHCNASADLQKSGAEVIFSPESKNESTSRYYSRLLTENIISTVGQAEIKSANFLVLKNSNIPAVMIEMGFMTNVKDFALLRDKRYQQKLAQDIYQGLLSIRNHSK